MTKALRVPPIKHSVYIGVPPARVYATLTTGEGWDEWFTSGTKVELGKVRRITLRWRDHGPDHIDYDDSGPVLKALKNRQFTFKWTASAVTKTIVDFKLKPRGKGTLLTITESGHKLIEADLNALVNCATGWGEAATLLKFYLEHGIKYGKVLK